MIIEPGALWAGTEASLHQVSQIAKRYEDTLAARGSSIFEDEDDDDNKPYEVTENGTAIIGIKGPMLNADLPEWVAQAFGLTTYPSLQRRFAQVAQDESVKRVLLDVNSGGGAVSGLSDTAAVLSELRAVKPVRTYAGDSCCSAAYWLGSASDRVGMSASGTIGSIGVIAVHISEKEAAEREGYKPTVMRSGAKKHLGHALEDFTPEAQAEMQRHMDFVHSRFIQAVAENRKLDLSAATEISDGRVFLGGEGVAMRLADESTTFNKFLADFEVQPASGHFNHPSGFTADNGVPTMNLEEALAKVAELEEASAAGQAALAESESKRAQAEAEVAKLTASNEALSASLAVAKEAEAAFAQNLDANITAMATALNAEVILPEDLAGKQKYFAQIKEKFEAKFPAGGVAASVVEPPKSEASDALAWTKHVVKG